MMVAVVMMLMSNDQVLVGSRTFELRLECPLGRSTISSGFGMEICRRLLPISPISFLPQIGDTDLDPVKLRKTRV